MYSLMLYFNFRPNPALFYFLPYFRDRETVVSGRCIWSMLRQNFLPWLLRADCDSMPVKATEIKLSNVIVTKI
jgi:hypothetical protein